MEATAARAGTARRLNCGCGPVTPAGWINSDRLSRAGVDVACDLRQGLPLPDACVDYAVAMRLLQDLAYGDLPRALAELRRVLVPGGVLRAGVPDLARAVDAWRRGDAAWFYVPDRDAARIGAKLVTQIVWYGSVRTPFTFDFGAELLGAAGFRDIVRCGFGATASRFPDIVTLDNRERETLFMEATR